MPIISPALLWASVINLERGNSADEKQFCIRLGLTLSEANLDGVTLGGYERLWEKVEGQIILHSQGPSMRQWNRMTGIRMESPCCTEPAHQTVVSPFLKLPLHHIRKKVLSWPFFPLTEKTAQIIAYWEIQPQSCWIPCSWNRPA